MTKKRDGCIKGDSQKREKPHREPIQRRDSLNTEGPGKNKASQRGDSIRTGGI